MVKARLGLSIVGRVDLAWPALMFRARLGRADKREQSKDNLSSPRPRAAVMRTAYETYGRRELARDALHEGCGQRGALRIGELRRVRLCWSGLWRLTHSL